MWGPPCLSHSSEVHGVKNKNFPPTLSLLLYTCFPSGSLIVGAYPLPRALTSPRIYLSFKTNIMILCSLFCNLHFPPNNVSRSKMTFLKYIVREELRINPALGCTPPRGCTEQAVAGGSTPVRLLNLTSHGAPLSPAPLMAPLGVCAPLLYELSRGLCGDSRNLFQSWPLSGCGISVIFTPLSLLLIFLLCKRRLRNCSLPLSEALEEDKKDKRQAVGLQTAKCQGGVCRVSLSPKAPDEWGMAVGG